MSETASKDEPFVIVAVDAHHSEFVDAGAVTDAPPEAALGMLLFVQDHEGWATLHRAKAFIYVGDERRVSFGPRILWPDGLAAARHTGHIPSDGASGLLSSHDDTGGGCA